MTETKTPAPRSLKPCTCSLFEVGTFDGDDENAPSWTTDCDRQTKSLFAQGHDAKLVSFLVKGHLDGYEVRRTDGGVSVTFPGPVEAAASASAPLGVKARRMLEVAAEKAKAKADREAKKAAAKTETKPAPAEEPKATEAAKPKTTRTRRKAATKA